MWLLPWGTIAEDSQMGIREWQRGHINTHTVSFTMEEPGGQDRVGKVKGF